MPISFRIRRSCRQPLGTPTSNRQPRPQHRPPSLDLAQEFGNVVEIDLGGEARLVARSARVGSLAAMVDPPLSAVWNRFQTRGGQVPALPPAGVSPTSDVRALAQPPSCARRPTP